MPGRKNERRINSIRQFPGQLSISRFNYAASLDRSVSRGFRATKSSAKSKTRHKANARGISLARNCRMYLGASGPAPRSSQVSLPVRKHALRLIYLAALSLRSCRVIQVSAAGTSSDFWQTFWPAALPRLLRFSLYLSLERCALSSLLA